MPVDAEVERIVGALALDEQALLKTFDLGLWHARWPGFRGRTYQQLARRRLIMARPEHLRYALTDLGERVSDRLWERDPFRP